MTFFYTRLCDDHINVSVTYILQSGNLFVVSILLCIVCDEFHSGGITAARNSLH